MALATNASKWGKDKTNYIQGYNPSKKFAKTVRKAALQWTWAQARELVTPPPSPTRGDGEGLFTFLSAQAKTGPISLSSGLSKGKKFDLIYCGIHKYEIKNVTSWSSPDANGGTIRTPERLTQQQYVCFFRPHVRKI